MSRRTRTWARFALIVVVVLLSLSVVSAQNQPKPEAVGLRPDAPPYALHGPYWVGTREFVIEDAERPLPVTVWYPALNPDQLPAENAYDAGVGEFMPGPLNLFPGHALVNAAPDTGQGPYPLVIFSHGAGASRFITAYYQEHLASYGMVVMAVEHMGSAIREAITVAPAIMGKRNLRDGMILRVLDVRRALDFAETLTASGGDLENVIDMEHAAVTGWSFGGATALMTAGARLDFDSLAAWCAGTIPTTSPGYETSCGLLEHKSVIAEQLGLSSEPEGLWPSMGDPRIDAVITMATGRVPAFGAAGLASVSIPSLTLIGEMDMVDAAKDNAIFSYEHIAVNQKAMVKFLGGGHMIFGNCSPAWRAGGFPFCFDAVWDMDRAHDLIDHFTTAFLLDVLKGDKNAHAALAPDAVSFPGIEYKAEGF